MVLWKKTKCQRKHYTLLFALQTGPFNYEKPITTTRKLLIKGLGRNFGFSCNEYIKEIKGFKKLLSAIKRLV